MSTDDQEVEAWYLEGWCFYLMAEEARENGGSLDDLTWQELGRDSRDCLETCQFVSLSFRMCSLKCRRVGQLHQNEEHPDKPLLGHVEELIAKLDELGIKSTPLDGDGDEEEGWDSVEGSIGGDCDVEMSYTK